MVFYQENPQELQTPKLPKNILPKKIPDWGALMNEHFSEKLTNKRWVPGENWQ